MKLGSALLVKAYKFAKQNQYSALTIAYDPDEPWTIILEYMLSKMGFQLLISPVSKYHITAEMLLSSPLMRNINSTKTVHHAQSPWQVFRQKTSLSFSYNAKRVTMFY